MESNRDFVITWRSAQDGSSYGIFAQRFASSGDRVGTEFQVNSFTPLAQRFADIASDQDGDFVVVWESQDQDGAEYGAFGQRWDSNGNKVGTEFQDGGFDGIFGQRFANDGSKLGPEFQVNTYTPLDQVHATVAMRPDGTFVVLWNSTLQDGANTGVFGQFFSATATKLGPEFQVNSYTAFIEQDASVAIAPNGFAAAAWFSFGQDGAAQGLFGNRIAEPAAEATPTPTASPTHTLTVSPTSSATYTSTMTPTISPTPSPTVTPTPTVTGTATNTATSTVTPTITPTSTPTAFPNGSVCTTPSDCASGFCVDGVCCDEACDGPTESCVIHGRVGTCTIEPAPTPAASSRAVLLLLAVLVGIGALGLRRRISSHG